MDSAALLPPWFCPCRNLFRSRWSQRPSSRRYSPARDCCRHREYADFACRRLSPALTRESRPAVQTLTRIRVFDISSDDPPPKRIRRRGNDLRIKHLIGKYKQDAVADRWSLVRFVLRLILRRQARSASLTALPLAQGPYAFLKICVPAVEVMRAIVPRRLADVIQVISLGGIQRRVD